MAPHQTHKIKITQRLSTRIVLAASVYSFLIALVVSGLQIYVAYQQAITDAKQQFQQIDSGYIANIVSGLWVVDNSRIEALVGGISHLPHVAHVELTDETHHSITRETSNVQNIIAEHQYPLIYREGDFIYDLGNLSVKLTDYQILHDLIDKSISIAITTFITILLGSVFVLFIFRQWISKPLETMARFAEGLDLNNLDKPLVLNRDQKNNRVDELDLVVNSINQMQATLQDGLEKRRLIELELVNHQEHLEDLVEERTAELIAKTRQLELQSDELETQNRELDAYAHSVAHDLKTPLTTIVGVSGLMQSSGINLTAEQTRESSAVINRTAKKMNAIIDALLLLASVRRTDSINPGIINLRELAEEACHRLERVALQHTAHIEIIGEWHNAIGYAQWIEEVWVNYISNAIKYGGTPPHIQIGCTSLANGMIKFWVRDFGAGIAVARRPELFVQFSRLDPRLADGHGLGLSIVKRIICRLDGDVGYEEADGDGGIFWFTLPAIK
ncbi:MAG: HAMP domain-containing protein [Gammaproteobacteria bacterium]|nr:MAG: HAMP domain-containing protein [Gammaproteobacteria bacterium]